MCAVGFEKPLLPDLRIWQHNTVPLFIISYKYLNATFRFMIYMI